MFGASALIASNAGIQISVFISVNALFGFNHYVFGNGHRASVSVLSNALIFSISG
jgi:hypothetical protein